MIKPLNSRNQKKIKFSDREDRLILTEEKIRLAPYFSYATLTSKKQWNSELKI